MGIRYGKSSGSVSSSLSADDGSKTIPAVEKEQKPENRGSFPADGNEDGMSEFLAEPYRHGTVCRLLHSCPVHFLPADGLPGIRKNGCRRLEHGLLAPDFVFVFLFVIGKNSHTETGKGRHRIDAFGIHGGISFGTLKPLRGQSSAHGKQRAGIYFHHRQY